MKTRMSTLPPQLRASMFFENPADLTEVEIKDRPAVATLEDLLDASTTAPVSAFTDHPFAGKIGSEVYKPQIKRQSTMPPDLNSSKSATGDSPKDKDKDKKRRSSFLGFRRMSASSLDLLNDTGGNKLKKRSSCAFSLGAKLDDAALRRDPSGALVGTGLERLL